MDRAAQQSDNASEGPVLCVDVDGTLLRTDLLFESISCLAREKPWLMCLLPVWLLRGKAYLKREVARHTTVGVIDPLFHKELLDFLRSEYVCGRRIVLCSGSDEFLVERIAAHMDFPVEVMASNGSINLTGSRKAHALVQRFGRQGFDYAGNADDDLPVWQEARRAVVVNASARVQRAAERLGNVRLVLPRAPGLVGAAVRAIRPYQWVKNGLVFVPLITSHHLLDVGLLLQAALAFCAMSCCASAIYIVNDLMDIKSDRHHASKRRRPFASGDLPVKAGFVMAPLLFGAGMAISQALSGRATLMLLFYAGLSIAYTIWLKRRLFVDAVTLSVLYAVRVLIGGIAISVLVSPWLLGFSLFMFLSLALTKRVAEMITVPRAESEELPGRAYMPADALTLTSFGAASSCLACVVLSFYINSDGVRQLYSHPGWLWLLVPLLLNWFGRLWLKTARRLMSDDPFVFLSKDRGTHVTLLMAAGIILLAMKLPFGIVGIAE